MPALQYVRSGAIVEDQCATIGLRDGPDNMAFPIGKQQLRPVLIVAGQSDLHSRSWRRLGELQRRSLTRNCFSQL